MHDSLVFDLFETLGIEQTAAKKGRRCSQRTPLVLPKPTDGYITMVVQRPVTFEDIRASNVGRDHMKSQDWYVGKDWYKQSIPSGNWLFRLMPDSRGKNTTLMRPLLRDGERFPGPAMSLAVTLFFRASGLDPLRNTFLTVDRADGNGYVVQIADKARLEIITHRDLDDQLSISAAALRV